MPPSNPKRDQIIAMYLAGERLIDIQATLEVTPNVLSGIIHRAGIANRGGTRPAFEDLSGKRFGLLTAISWAGRCPHGSSLWWCWCDCGARHKVEARNLKSGSTKSCGCVRSAKSSQRMRMMRVLWLSREASA